MIGFCPLASGSKGNSIYFGTENTRVLFDAGLGVRTLEERLCFVQTSLQEIRAIFISHEHSDHIKGLPSILRKHDIPVFANSETAKAMIHELGPISNLHIFATGETFFFEDLEIHPFSVQHDTLDPVAFTVTKKPIKVGICTDLGHVSTLVVDQLQRCSYLYIEANHEPSMVHACPRPPIYKQRVLSRQGHLSNAQCRELIELIAHKDLKHIYLAHLSSECNHPDLALQTIREKIQDLGLTTSVSIASQHQPSTPIRFTSNCS